MLSLPDLEEGDRNHGLWFVSKKEMKEMVNKVILDRIGKDRKVLPVYLPAPWNAEEAQV